MDKDNKLCIQILCMYSIHCIHIYYLLFSFSLKRVNVGWWLVAILFIAYLQYLSINEKRKKIIFISYIIKYAFTIPSDHLLSHADRYYLNSNPFRFQEKPFIRLPHCIFGLSLSIT